MKVQIEPLLLRRGLKVFTVGVAMAKVPQSLVHGWDDGLEEF